MTAGQRAHLIAGQLLEQLAGADTAAGPVLKLARAAGLSRRLAGSFPPVDDHESWCALLEHFAGILLAITDRTYLHQDPASSAGWGPEDELQQLLADGRATVAAMLPPDQAGGGC